MTLWRTSLWYHVRIPPNNIGSTPIWEFSHRHLKLFVRGGGGQQDWVKLSKLNKWQFGSLWKVIYGLFGYCNWSRFSRLETLVRWRNRRRVWWFPPRGDGILAFFRFCFATMKFLALMWVIGGLRFQLPCSCYRGFRASVVFVCSRIKETSGLPLLLSARKLRWCASDWQRGKYCAKFYVIGVLQTRLNSVLLQLTLL